MDADSQIQFTPYQKKMVFLSCFILVIGFAAIDFINPSLPYIMKELHISQANTKGLIIVYLITMGVAQIFYGTFSDNYGRKKAILIGFLIAVIGLILSAISKTIMMLYMGRFLTALGTSSCPVISRALISDACTNSAQLAKAFSYFTISTQISPAFAPVLGGIIQYYANWHWSFFALALINTLVFILLFFIMPESHELPNEKNSLTQQVMIYLKLLSHSEFALFSLLSGLILVFTVGFYSLSPFILHSMGFSAIQISLFFLVYVIGLVMGSLCLATFFTHVNAENAFLGIIVVYPILTTLSIGIFLLYGNNVILIILFSFCLAFCCGIAAPLVLSLCLRGFSKNKGAASALQSFFKFSITSLVLLLFNFIVLHHFVELIYIFEVIAWVILLLYLAQIMLFRNE